MNGVKIMSMKHLKYAVIASLLAGSISPAYAQFGGMGPKLPGVGSGASSSSVSSADIDSYLARSKEAAIMIGTASILLTAAAKGKIDRAGAGAQVKALRGSANAKELAAAMSFMKSDDAANKLNGANADALEKNIASASAEDKVAIGAALVNLAIGIPRAIQLAKQAPEMIKGIGSNPSSLGQIGKLKDAGGLLVLQVKYTAEILPVLPRIMSAAKVKLPANAETSKGVVYGKDFE